MSIFGSRSTLLLSIPSFKVFSDLWCHPDCQFWCRHQWPRIYTGGNWKTFPTVPKLNMYKSNSRCRTSMCQQHTANYTCTSISTMVRQSKLCSRWLGIAFGQRQNNSLVTFSSRFLFSLFHPFALSQFKTFTLSLFFRLSPAGDSIITSFIPLEK